MVADDPNAPRGRINYTSPSILLETLKSKLLVICPCVFQNHDASRSNNARSQKLAVFYMAMSYSLTWALTWIPYVIIMFVTRNKTTHIISAVLQPVQGLYNLIVYKSPKVRNARNRKRGKSPWCQAIAKAWTSRGAEDRAIVGYRYTKTSSLRQYFQSRLQYLDSWTEEATYLLLWLLRRKQASLVIPYSHLWLCSKTKQWTSNEDNQINTK